MKVLLINNGTKHLGKLKELLAVNEIDTYSYSSKFPPLAIYNLIILSGGSQLALLNAPEVFKEEIDLIKNTDKPIIGICEGCQLIAYSFGSTLEFVENKVKGIKQIEIINEDHNLFNSLESLSVYEAHHWAIKKLGKDLTALAKSKYGFEIIKHKDKNIYGLQFHPEMLVNKTKGDELFKKIIFLTKYQPNPPELTTN